MRALSVLVRWRLQEQEQGGATHHGISFGRCCLWSAAYESLASFRAREPGCRSRHEADRIPETLGRPRHWGSPCSVLGPRTHRPSLLRLLQREIFCVERVERPRRVVVSSLVPWDARSTIIPIRRSCTVRHTRLPKCSRTFVNATYILCRDHVRADRRDESLLNQGVAAFRLSRSTSLTSSASGSHLSSQKHTCYLSSKSRGTAQESLLPLRCAHQARSSSFSHWY
ncbi:hypothetical protein C8Q76DRAFT_159878 [Earliella scabrosa]|nr:hypothetical protein C8Q76DRAFT_159878 [Earliella scabrosa]